MKFKVTPRSAIRCIKFCVGPVLCWPPPRSASKSDLIIRDVLLLLAACCPLIYCVFVPMALYGSRHDAVEVTKFLYATVDLCMMLTKMSMFRYHRDKFQIYYAEMEECAKLEDTRENAIFENYMDRCGPLYISFWFCGLTGLVLFCCGPLIFPQSILGDGHYPFPLDDPPVLITVYIMEVWEAIQVLSSIYVDVEIAMLLWFCGMRFELLAEEFQAVASLSDFNRCVEKHQELLTFTDGVFSAVRHIILVVTSLTCLANICTGYQLVQHPPIAISAQFFFMFCASSMGVLLYAWPADNLMAVSESIVHAVYDSNWTGQSPEMLKNIQIVMLRAQRPLIISVRGFLSKLDLDYYGSYLTASFSYFTTLQAVVD